MQQSNQEIYTNQTDEINLRGIINFFAARKFIIFGITGFVTFLAIIVAFTLTPTYRVVSLFTTPSDSGPYLLKAWQPDPEFVDQMEKLRFVTESNQSVFSNYLTALSSPNLQKKVFLDGGYVTAFNPEKKPIDDIESFIAETLASLKVSPPIVTSDIIYNKKQVGLGSLTELPYSVSMEGSNIEVMSRYLDELVTSADKKTVDKFLKIMRQKIDNNLTEITIESRLLLIKAREERLNKIEVLTEAAKIARSLGIIENNLNITSNFVTEPELEQNPAKPNYPTLIPKSFTPSRLDSDLLPEWYLYGEKALLQRIEMLKSRTSDEPFIPELIDLNDRKRKLETAIVEKPGLTSMELSQAATPLIGTIKPDKRAIVLIAFIGSLILSILSALVMDLLKTNGRRLT